MGYIGIGDLYGLYTDEIGVRYGCYPNAGESD